MVLVTGGAGYIGSHTSLELLEAGYDIVVFDNFCNSSKESIRRVEELTSKDITLIEGDMRSFEDLQSVFANYSIDSVIHFAGLKAVGESVEKPLEYYDNNIVGTLRLLQTMQKFHCKKLVFSSSATVYGHPHTTPIQEDFPLNATNPYGRTKLFIEEILRDFYRSDPSFNIAILRYFNPAGAHHSGRIGEDPDGIPNNLFPFISQTAVGRHKEVIIFGNDYDTKDGTGVRDYIHVVDLALGHIKALEKLQEDTEILTINLGTGKGYSVLEVIAAFEKAANKSIAYTIAPRRPGDIAECFADPSYAKEILGWSASRTLETMCEDAWRWQKQNPNGYQT